MCRRNLSRVDEGIQTLDGELGASETKERMGGRKQPEGRSEGIPMHLGHCSKKWSKSQECMMEIEEEKKKKRYRVTIETQEGSTRYYLNLVEPRHSKKGGKGGEGYPTVRLTSYNNLGSGT